MIDDSLVTDNVGGTGGGAIVLWRDRGDRAPRVNGLQAHAVGNTPKDVATRTGTDGC